MSVLVRLATFGGVIPTPTLDRIAQMGLRYTRFHTTALCSPTRAALLTGHNHHSVGTGVVVDQATGYPGYDSIIPRDAVCIGEILKQNGYETSWYGKDHNVPQWEASPAGPFHNWPTGPIKGFDYFYGFVGDDTSQWEPNNLFRNTTAIQPYLGHPGWNLITAMADDAIDHIKMLDEAGLITKRHNGARRSLEPRADNIAALVQQLEEVLAPAAVKA